jgi:hypothetical protein
MVYWAEQFDTVGVYTSFNVLIGAVNDRSVESFDTLNKYNRVNTVPLIPGDLSDYDTASFEFSVDNSGDYVLSILPTEYSFVDEYFKSYLGFRYINVERVWGSGIVLPVKAGNTLSIYPVPTSAVLTVDGVQKGVVSVIDMTGKTVIRRNANSTRMLLDVQALPNGVYMLYNGDRSAKFIKKQ